MNEKTLNRWADALAAGFAGALALTAVHQLARRVTDSAPRMDVLGERALARGVAAAGGNIPPQPRLHMLALAGDLMANSAYYSLVACGAASGLWRRAVVLGLAAGTGALLLPERMGLGAPPRSDRIANQVMTVAWYLLGALAAAGAGAGIRRRVRAAA
jgi:hypothetical protein